MTTDIKFNGDSGPGTISHRYAEAFHKMQMDILQATADFGATVLDCDLGDPDKPISEIDRYLPGIVRENYRRVPIPALSSWSQSLPWSTDLVAEMGLPMTINQELQYYYDKNRDFRNLESPFEFRTDGSVIIRGYPLSSPDLESRAPDKFTRVDPMYVSGNLNTWGLFEFHYGYLEARVKVPKTCGSWPAFWLMDQKFDKVRPHEIDIFEIPISCDSNPWTSCTNAHHALHMTDPAGTLWSIDGGGVKRNYKNDDRVIEPCVNPDSGESTEIVIAPELGTSIGPTKLATGSGSFADDSHVFGCLWQNDRVIWYVDGVQVASVCERGSVPTDPMAAVINLAIGGTYPNHDAARDYRDQMEIDYVRYFR